MLLACACGGMQSALEPAGPQAGHIATLWWVLLAISVAVWVAVCAALAMALWRRDRTIVEAPTDGEPAKVRSVAIAGAFTTVILVGLVTYSVMVGRETSRAPSPETVAVEVDVIGHQWWWELRYRDARSNHSFTTANELRIPVGRPVVLRLQSRDVIHSFWVPNLHGKLDLLPGRTNTLWLQADRAGRWRGQCAEFCGVQHAKMALLVIAEPDEAFEAWSEGYRAPVRESLAVPLSRGASVFREAQCVLCHSVRSVEAFATAGPDLTRLAERHTIASGTLRNTPDNLRAWITDPQAIKPGTFMPATPLDPEQLDALVDYLGSLR